MSAPPSDMPPGEPPALPAVLDWARAERTGLPEAVLCDGKSPAQIGAIVAEAKGRRLFFTRLSPEAHGALPAAARDALVYHEESGTARLGPVAEERDSGVAVVAAGLGDAPTALEAVETLAFAGHRATLIGDVGVAGLWRLMARLEDIRTARVVIAVAGMEGALFSVLGGLVAAPIIACPAPVGYGVGAGGEAALTSALTSCADGIVAVNIGNGYGAACAALRILNTS